MKYLGSKSRIAKHILSVMLDDCEKSGIKSWVEPFCLKENTVVQTNRGMLEIKDVLVGDYVYDENCVKRKVVRKVKSPEHKGLHIKLKGGVIIEATGNHKFYLSSGEDVIAKDIKVGDSLLTGKCHNTENLTLDIAPHITKCKNDVKSSRGGIVLDDKVKLYHNSDFIDRYIDIDEEFCWALGLVVAEGSKGCLTLNIKETNIAERFIKVYSKITSFDFSDVKIYYPKLKNNSLNVAIPKPKVYENIFFKLTGIGYGARDKNIDIAFDLKPSCVLSLIRGMHDGDGSLCKKGKYYNWNYKTSSKTLAKQLQMLLITKFGIKSTVSYGINKVRHLEGRKLNESDYHNVSVNRAADVSFLLGYEPYENIRNINSKGFCVTTISESVGDFYDITLEDNSSHRFIIQGGIVTHNCGGGNLIDKVPNTFTRIGYDANPHTIAAMQQIRDNPDALPTYCSEEYYKSIKGTQPNGITSWLRFVCSFGGKFENGYSRSNVKSRNYCLEGRNNALKQSDLISDVVLICNSYENLDFPLGNSLIYCDPPYKGVTGYKAVKQFDYDGFYEWCCKQTDYGNLVYVSEYNIDHTRFHLMVEVKVSTTLSYNRVGGVDKVERLYKVV